MGALCPLVFQLNVDDSGNSERQCTYASQESFVIKKFAVLVEKAGQWWYKGVPQYTLGCLDLFEKHPLKSHLHK